MDIGGFQDRAFDGVSFIVRNAGSLRQQGFEFDTMIAPTRDFSFTGSVAYLDSKFTSFANGSGLAGCNPVGGVIPAICVPRPSRARPEPDRHAEHLLAEMGWQFRCRLVGDIGSGGLTWALNGNLSFVGNQFVGTQNDGNPQSLADGYALLGARLTISGQDDRWSVSVFGSNLADKNYRPLSVYQPLGGTLGLNNTVFTGSAANRVQASEPRT